MHELLDVDAKHMRLCLKLVPVTQAADTLQFKGCKMQVGTGEMGIMTYYKL